jgi:hypothetical protein
MLQVGRSRVLDPMRSLNFSIYLIFPAAPGHEVYSVSNKNEYQKQGKNKFLGIRARPARKADNLTAICDPII